MKRKFLTNVLLLVFLNLLVKPFWIFGVDRTVQNLVGSGEWGLYFSLFSFSIIFNVFLDLGVTSYSQRSVSQHQHMVGRFLTNIVFLKFILALLYGVLVLGAALVIGYDSRQVQLLAFLALNQFLISFTLYLRSNISGMQFYATDSLLSVLDKLLMILICSALLWFHPRGGTFRVEWFVYGQTIAYALTTVIVFGVTLARTGAAREVFRARVDLRQVTVMVKQTMPYALLVLLMALYNRLDSVLLERILPDGKEQVGIFGQAFRIFDALAMFGFLSAGLLLPMFSRMLKKKEPVNQLVQFSSLLILVPSLTLTAASFFYSDHIMKALYDAHSDQSARLLPWLMLAFLSVSLTYIFGTLLTANGSLKALNQMAFMGLLLNLVLNFVLIPRYQALGSAWASAATQAFTAIAQIIIVRKKFHFRVNTFLFARLIFFSFSVILLSGYTERLPLLWYQNLLCLMISSMLLAFLLRLINLRSILNLLRETSPA